jgi:phosphotransferase system enzyme I (PtsI)/phosphotransferase system enzyme I (PtsP)
MIDVVLELTRITQAVSMVSTAQEQLGIIVNGIRECFGISVCSLYRLDKNEDLVLLASHGLHHTRPVKIPKGKGLVGLVVKSRHTINLANGLKHSDYFYVKDIKEEQFKSFCGAPLVTKGEVIGVLVLQDEKPQKLSEKKEAFINTMASHIALIVQQMPLTLSKPTINTVLKGISASEGVAVGYPYVCVKPSLNDVSLSYNDNPEKEIKLWEKVLQQVLDDLELEKQALKQHLSAEMTHMFEAYKMLLFDQSLSDKVVAGVNERFSLQKAIKLAVQHFSDLFKQMEDPYLRARSEDVWHIGNKLYQALIGTEDEPFKQEGNIILIGNEISVSDIADIPVEQLKGIVCTGGSRLSHTAIVANALGVQAIMGVPNLLEQSYKGKVIVDATQGLFFANPTKSILHEYSDLVDRQIDLDKILDDYKDRPAMCKDGTRINLFTNSGLLSDISPGIRYGAEGIGLFRTEIPFIMSDTFPTEKEQFELYKNVFSSYQDKPVYMRTLDIGADKQLPYFPITGEENPAMGWRGIRFTLDNIQLLMTQVRAMLRAAGLTGDLKVILPMVSSLDELVTFHRVLDDALNQLQLENIAVKRPEVGVMIEVPAAISQIKFWTDYIDFISIGSNDLSQYLLALDRNNPKVASRFDHVHPAIIHEIYRIVEEAKKVNLPVSVCGEMASNPIAVVLLLAMGIRKLSVSSAQIPKLKALIKNLDEPLMNKFLLFALKQDSADKIRFEGQSIIKDFSPL